MELSRALLPSTAHRGVILLKRTVRAWRPTLAADRQFDDVIAETMGSDLQNARYVVQHKVMLGTADQMAWIDSRRPEAPNDNNTYIQNQLHMSTTQCSGTHRVPKERPSRGLGSGNIPGIYRNPSPTPAHLWLVVSGRHPPTPHPYYLSFSLGQITISIASP